LAVTFKEKFSKLENELQRDVSTKVVVMRDRKISDGVWNLCVHNILQGKHNNHYFNKLSSS